ncbi:MAG: DUF3574 domain-containing protein [Caulobacteraceae bacterium]
MPLVLAMLALGGCAAMDAPSCPAGTSAMPTAELFFGRNIGSEIGVSEDDWRTFLAEEVTPRFPAGLSVTDVAGQWRDADGTIVREPSKALFLVLSGGPGEAERIEAIREAYKTRFGQHGVMLVRGRACVSF